MTTELNYIGRAASEGYTAAKEGKPREVPEALEGDAAKAWLDGYDAAKKK